MDIIGFNAQIAAPRKVAKFVKKVSAKLPAPTQKIVKRVVAPTSNIVKRVVAPTKNIVKRVVAPTKKMVVSPSTFSKMTPGQRRAAVLQTTAIKPSIVKQKSSLLKKKVVPAQIPMTAKTRSNVLPTSRTSAKAPMAVVKRSGKSIPVSTLTKTTNPNIVQAASPVQQSFMPVDLPFKKVTPLSKLVKLKYTPISYSVSTDLIEPNVDSGVQNYYGK
jgi:hypothetical protein